jgi:hypothetical protein
MSTPEPPSHGPLSSGDPPGQTTQAETTQAGLSPESLAVPDPSPASGAASPPAASSSQAWLQVFLTTATTVFLAELGDKTQLAALLLSAQSGRPAVVFVGASLALICSSLVGVLLGRWLSRCWAFGWAARRYCSWRPITCRLVRPWDESSLIHGPGPAPGFASRPFAVAPRPCLPYSPPPSSPCFWPN